MDLSFYEEPCETTPINVSTWTFKLMAKNSAGVTQWTWDNATFASGATTNQRIVTLSAVTTATYIVGEYAYDLQVTKADGVYTYMTGFVIVEDQITS
jgi:hypothetical protein